MHVAYSAIRQTNSPASNPTLSRYLGYQAACIKHADTIAQIQRFLPGWMPRLSIGSRQLADDDNLKVSSSP